VSVTIVNGEAIDAGGAVPGKARLRKGSRTARRVPNDLFRQARLALRSPSGSGRPMSRQELAEAANAWVYEHTGRVCRMDACYIGMVERGETRWPWEHHRAGLRGALGAATDAEIGLWITYNPAGPTGTIGDGAGTEPARTPVPTLPEPEPDGSAVTTAEHGPSLLRTILADRHWQVYRTFRVQFARAARELAEREGDPTVRTLDVSERQFKRWQRGVQPRPDACRVLESMFGHPITRLIGPAEAPAIAAGTEPTPHAAPDGPVSATSTGLALPEGAAGLSEVQVSVNAGAGAAVTVTCLDGAPGRVSVVAGAVRVLIDASGVDAGVVDAPMVAGGARVYSLAERRAR
jgi:hypothetical protein